MPQSEYDNWLILNRHVDRFEHKSFREISNQASWGVQALMNSLYLDMDMEELLNNNIFSTFQKSTIYKAGITGMYSVERLDGVINGNRIICLNGLAFFEEHNDTLFSQCMQKYNRYVNIIMEKCKIAQLSNWPFSSTIMPDEVNPD